jgi:MFS family permease
LYNAIFFTYALVLTKFYGISDSTVPLYLLPFAVGNFFGPLLLGPLFAQDILTATTQTIAWDVIFFFASAGASAAYLTVSENFPIETRAMAISVFYAFGTVVGGTVGPLLFGRLIQTGTPGAVFIGYLVGAALMIVAGLVEMFLGVEAAGRGGARVLLVTVHARCRRRAPHSRSASARSTSSSAHCATWVGRPAGTS